VGKSRSHVSNMLRLLKLPAPVKELINAGRLSAGHARAILASTDPEAAARDLVERGLNVRQAEALSQEQAPALGSAKPRPRAVKDADTRAVEKRLSDALGLAVEIDHRGQRGTMKIRYRNLDQLDDLIRRLERNS
jgi:ParB family chromosome partitioning protein